MPWSEIYHFTFYKRRITFMSRLGIFRIDANIFVLCYVFVACAYIQLYVCAKNELPNQFSQKNRSNVTLK